MVDEHDLNEEEKSEQEQENVNKFDKFREFGSNNQNLLIVDEIREKMNRLN